MVKTAVPRKYQSRHRLTWAARFPLRPGRDLCTRRAILVQIADTAISGKYWETQGKLAARVGLTVRGLQKALDKLCAEGALSRQTRGYKRTTCYTLLRLDEVAEHGDFLPAEEVQKQFPLTAARDVERNGGSSYIGGTLESPTPGETTVETNGGSSYIVRTLESPTPGENGLETNGGSSRNGLRRTGVRPKKRLKEEEEVSKPNGLLDATANGAPRLPSASKNSSSSFSLTEEEEDTHADERPVSATARTLSDYVAGGTGRPLPGSWLTYPGLDRELNRRGFLEAGSVIAGILERTGGDLPEPEDFFERYRQYRQIHLAVSAHRRNGKGRRRAA